MKKTNRKQSANLTQWVMTMALALVMFHLSLSVAQAQAKREFRGAWIQCVNGQFQGIGTERMQQTLTTQLNELQRMGVNAIIFQVRPECDALYQSSLEPWSRFLTGRQGQAPTPYWDPLAWMVEQCHLRGMELHAWINPYRAKTKGTAELAQSHVAIQHPDRAFYYDDMLILNPGLAENRDYICNVARDIVTRYDVDGIHMDDYFYPYPAAGQVIPDDDLFRRNPNGFNNIGDWRRHNVNLFIRQFYETVHHAKPWVKVGISPFGIYRNKRSAEIGSNTNGLQNYDDLYADVLLWINNGWLDYCVPQIYWEIGHKSADYETLIRWWNQYAGRRPLFIGEDIERTVKNADPRNPSQHQQAAKHALHQQMPNVQGTVLWYAKAAVDNTGNYGAKLRTDYWRYPALQPQMHFIDKKAPKAPRKLKPVWMKDGYVLCWSAPKGSYPSVMAQGGKHWGDVVDRYVVYRFAKNEQIDLNNPAKIVAITPNTFLKLPFVSGGKKYVYVVTALDRLQNESNPAKKTVKL